MGAVKNITFDRRPKQGQYLNRRCEVVFHYDTSRVLTGTIIRDDAEAPGELLIQLDDTGFVLRAAECQYSPMKAEETAPALDEGGH